MSALEAALDNLKARLLAHETTLTGLKGALFAMEAVIQDQADTRESSSLFMSSSAVSKDFRLYL